MVGLKLLCISQKSSGNQPTSVFNQNFISSKTFLWWSVEIFFMLILLFQLMQTLLSYNSGLYMYSILTFLLQSRHMTNVASQNTSNPERMFIYHDNISNAFLMGKVL